MKRSKIITTLVVASLITVSSITSVFASTNEVVTLGANLTPQQKEQMYQAFGVKPDEVKTITMTVQDIRKQLGMPPAPANVKGNAYSSAFVRIEEPGYGIKVKTSNMTAVTPEMLENALVTSGVTDADVIATAPFEVSGTSALAGVIQAFEDATGKEVPVEQKQAAQKEITVTNQLAEATTGDGKPIGQNRATTLIAETKKEVIKEQPKNDVQIGQIVNNVTNNYNVKLTPEQQQEMVQLMSKINDLNLNYDSMKKQLNSMTDKMENLLEQNGEQLKKINIIQRGVNKILDWCQSFKNWCITTFGSGNISQDGVTYDKDGKIIEPSQSTDSNKNEESDAQGQSFKVEVTDDNGAGAEQENSNSKTESKDPRVPVPISDTVYKSVEEIPGNIQLPDGKGYKYVLNADGKAINHYNSEGVGFDPATGLYSNGEPSSKQEVSQKNNNVGSNLIKKALGE